MGGTCFTIIFFFSSRRRHTRWTGDWSSDVCSSDLQLQVIELHRRRPAEERDRDPHLALVRNHFLHRAAEIRKRPLGDLHHLPHQERNLVGRLFFRRGLLDAQEPVHFVGPERHRQPVGPHELDHALHAVDGVNRLLIHHHLHQHVAGVDLPLLVFLLAVLDLHHHLGGDQRLPDRLVPVGPRVFLDAAVDQRAHLVLVSRGGLDRVPAVLRHQKLLATNTTSSCWNSQSIQPIATPRIATKIRITTVAFRSSVQVGQVIFLISWFTRRRNSTVRPNQLRRSPDRASVPTLTSTPCAPAACYTAGRTSSTPRARGACAGSWW